MLLHHALHPELPHSLDYVTSVYGNIPYWKATLKKAKSQLEIDNKELRTYNARDCLAMMQIEPELEAECIEQGTHEIYKDISMPLLPIVLEMNNNGLPVDASRLVTWRSELTSRNESILDAMSNLWPIHKAFNWNAGQHVAWLFYGKKPKTYSEKEVGYANYFVPGCKLKRNTKKFQALEEYIKVFTETKPFRTLVDLSIKMTATGPSTDEEMRVRIREAIIRRTEKLINMTRKTEEHYDEETDIAAMRQIIDNLMEYATNGKLISTYTKLHIEPDGRVHPGFRISGTATGRLSSYSPNGQNLPPDAKRIFVAPKGWKFIQFDYTNLELVVLAYIAGVSYLISVFKQGLNVHDENTKRFLEINKTHPEWDNLRRVMKMYVFGRNYGGGLKGMYRRLLTGIPGLQMTFKQFEELDKKYFDLMPEYKVWYNETIDTLRRTRTLTNAFGRMRIFLGPIDNIVREGLNFPIQGSAADIMSLGLIDFFKVYKEAKAQGARMQLVLSVHDSAVVLAPESEIKDVLRLFASTFCKPRRIGEYDVSFKGDVKIMDDLKGKKEDEKSLDEWVKEYDSRTA
jgi:DNA polymerase I-like protein with 3'-5' exonuclease and polymerase domains